MIKGFRGYDYRKRLMGIVKKEKPDLIYTRSAQIALCCLERSYDVVYECHGLILGEQLAIEKIILSPNLKAVVVISDALRGIMIRMFGKSIEDLIIVAHDGVDLVRFDSLPKRSPNYFRNQLGLPEHPTVCYSGHLYRSRGIEFTLEIAKLIPDANFIFVGGLPDDVERCKSLSKSMGLLNTTFTGFIPNADLPRYLRASNILIMPYQKKVGVHNNPGADTGRFMSPMKMFEYMASLRPIITTDLPVLSEVLDDKQCIMAAVGKHQDWCKAIRRLLGDQTLADELAKNAHRNVQGYEWSLRARRILSEISKW